MRRVLRWPLVLLLSVTLASGVVLVGLATDTGYTVTCCSQADINHLWQPGTTVNLHWTVESEPNLFDRVFDRFENPGHQLFIRAFLSGPYSDLAGLKRTLRTGFPVGAYPVVDGSVVALDDRTRPSTAPVTIFNLPADLPPGYYDLTLLWQDANGGTGDPNHFVRVGTQ